MGDNVPRAILERLLMLSIWLACRHFLRHRNLGEIRALHAVFDLCRCYNMTTYMTI